MKEVTSWLKSHQVSFVSGRHFKFATKDLKIESKAMVSADAPHTVAEKRKAVLTLHPQFAPLMQVRALSIMGWGKNE